MGCVLRKNGDDDSHANGELLHFLRRSLSNNKPYSRSTTTSQSTLGEPVCVKASELLA